MAKPVQDIQSYYRYCPGEERNKISDAVCLGRRRSNYPKCKGCPFNDAEKAEGESEALSMTPERLSPPDKLKHDRIESLFRDYDIRGIYPDPLDEEAAWRIGLAVAQFLRAELRGYDRSRLEKSAVVVARDMRKSSPLLAGALIEGIRAGGSPVIDIGMVDTGQLYFAVNHLTCCGGVQVTASRNPGEYNGFEICGLKGKPFSSDTGLGKICKIAKNTRRRESTQMAGLDHCHLGEPYKNFVRGFLKPAGAGINTDNPLKVVVDASNGMAGRWFPLLFGDIDWLEIIRLNFEHNGEFVHDPDPTNETNLGQLKDRMARAKADLGVCFDGDADCCVFVDDTGRPVRADLTTALLAGYLLKDSPGATVVYDLRSSRVVPEEVHKAGGVPRRERCGHAFIRKTLADSKGVLAGELGGHFYFRDNWYCDSGMLAFAQLLNVISEKGKPLSELVSPLQRYAHSGSRNFHNDDQKETTARVVEKYGDARIDYLDGLTVRYDEWWFNIRPSSTEPLLHLIMEANNETILQEKLTELCPLLGSPLEDH